MKYLHKPAVNTHRVCACLMVCMSFVLSMILTPGCSVPIPHPTPHHPLLLPWSPAPLWCGLSDDVQHLLHLYAHPGLQPLGAAHLHGGASGQCFPLQVNLGTYPCLLHACTHASIFLLPFFIIYVINDFFLLALSWPAPEKLRRMPCYGGDPSSTGLYLESSTACSFSLVLEVCSVTQHCRITARFDCIPLQ